MIAAASVTPQPGTRAAHFVCWLSDEAEAGRLPWAPHARELLAAGRCSGVRLVGQPQDRSLNWRAGADVARPDAVCVLLFPEALAAFLTCARSTPPGGPLMTQLVMARLLHPLVQQGLIFEPESFGVLWWRERLPGGLGWCPMYRASGRHLMPTQTGEALR